MRTAAPLLLVLLAGLGCVDDAPATGGADMTVPDGAPDAGDAETTAPDDTSDALDDADADTDATGPDATGPDATDDTDAVNPGNPLFDSLAVEAPAQRLELCVVTSDATAMRMVRLGPLARSTTAETALAAATLGPVDVLVGPFAGQQDLDAVPIASELTAWNVSTGPDSVRLQAVVHHEVGAAGAVEERYDVTRADAGDTRPVAVDGVGEVTFWWVGSSAASDVQLLPCQTSGDAFQARVLVAAKGDRRVALLDIADPRAQEQPATRRVSFFDGEPGLEVDAETYWALDVARDADGTPQQLALDLTRSVTHRQLYFAGQTSAAVTKAISAVEVEGDTVTVVTRTLADGVDTPEDWDVELPWTRVDAQATLEAHSGACGDDPVATTLVGLPNFGPRFRLVFCPTGAAPGIDLIAVTPVVLDEALEIVGKTYTDVAPFSEAGRPGFEVDLDGLRLTLTREGTSGWFYLNLYDAAGDGLVSQLADEVSLIADAIGGEYPVEQATADGTVSVVISRLWAAQGAGFSTIFAPTAFRLERGSDVVRVEAWDLMDYTNTHHNWSDVLEVVGDGEVYRWTVVDLGQGALLEVEDPQGTVVESYDLLGTVQ